MSLYREESDSASVLPFRTAMKINSPNSSLYCYDQIKCNGKSVVQSMDFVKLNKASTHYKFVFLMSFVLSDNGAHSYFKGSECENVINLM